MLHYLPMFRFRTLTTLFLTLGLAAPLAAQEGARNGEWHVYGADSGSTKYSGYQLVGLDAKTGRLLEGFGEGGIVNLREGLDRDVVGPGEIGSSSPAIVVNDVIIMGAALLAGGAPASKTNVPGHIRGYDVRTGKQLWTFRTLTSRSLASA